MKKTLGGVKEYLIESAHEAERLDFQNKIDVYDLRSEVRSFPWPAGHRVLDAGCGHGNLIEELQEYDLAAIHGIDLCPERVQSGRERFRSDPRVQLHQGNLEATGLPEASYDIVVCRYVFEHLVNPQAVLRELTRCLRPGGSFYLINFDDIFFNFHTKSETLNQELRRLKGELPQDFEIGRKLPQYLRSCGFGGVSWEARAYFFQGERLALERQNARMRLEQARPAFLRFFETASAYDAFA